MKDLGRARQILGMRITRDQDKKTLMLSQAEYIERVLARFSMDKSKPVSSPLGSQIRLSSLQYAKTDEERSYMENVPYSSAIGSLMYAMVCTMPDIAHAVGAVSRYACNPGRMHWEAVKWILRYLRGNTDVPLCFGQGSTLRGYVDADFAGDVDLINSFVKMGPKRSLWDKIVNVIYNWSYNRGYIDSFYAITLNTGIRGLVGLTHFFDKRVIDGITKGEVRLGMSLPWGRLQ